MLIIRVNPESEDEKYAPGKQTLSISYIATEQWRSSCNQVVTSEQEKLVDSLMLQNLHI